MADRSGRIGRVSRIGIDARELLGRPTGVGRFLAEVLKAWARDPHAADDYTLFLPGPAPAWTASLGPRFHTAIDPADTAGTWWEQVRLPRLVEHARVDVLLSPAYTTPLRLHRPTVVVIHDVSFFAHPEWFGWREGLRRRWLTKRSAHHAACVLTVSEFSAREIERWTGVSATKVGIVRHGAPDVPPSPDARFARGFGGASRQDPLVLFVGSLFNRRRLPEMIEAFARVGARLPDARFVLVGENRTSPRVDPLALAARFGAAGRVEWRDYTPDAELDALYGAAGAFVFLSDYEGFAMTPLEAIAHGVPPVLLDTPVAREVYGRAARYVPPDVGAIAGAIEDLLMREDERARLLAEGRQLLERYTWAQAARDVREALERAV